MFAELEKFLSISQFNKFVDVFSKAKAEVLTLITLITSRLILKKMFIHLLYHKISYSLIVILET